MKTIFSTFICLFMVLVPTYQKECHTEHLNNCIIPSIVRASRNMIPDNEKALEKRCAMCNKSWECVDEFMDKCVADIHHMLYDLITDYRRVVFEEMCQKGSQFQKEYLKIAPCLSEAVNSTRKVCLKTLEKAIYQTMGEDIESRVPAGCCYFMQFNDCFYDQVEKSCGMDAFPTVEKASNIFGMAMTQTFCSSYDPDSNICVDIFNRNVTSPSGKYSYLARFIVTMLKNRS